MRRRDRGSFLEDTASTEYDEASAIDVRWRTMGKARKAVLVVAAVAFPLVLLAGVGYGVVVAFGNAAPLMAPSVAFAEGFRSHVEYDVPDSEDFDRLLDRDVQSYFEERIGKWVTVTCELLSDKPYRVGLSYPKFNVWVRVSEGGGSLSEGLAWVAAVDKMGFEVYEYWSAEELRENFDSLEGAFPADDYPQILKKLSE